ncbi:hypothetical protein MMC10_007446 [Thelotrema lepadinum]|nr:hypothetical protein [Thelotrema lepadinum]
MASHSLAIAKASLAAGFMRPDPVPVSRDEVSFFHDALESALARCTPANIQRCKEWLLDSGVSSSTRVTSVGKYLVALSSSLGKAGSEGLQGAKRGSSSRRRQLHIIYLLNDLLHHLRHHTTDSPGFAAFAQSLQPYLADIVSNAAAYDSNVYTRQHNRVSDVLKVWETQSYFDRSFLEALRESVREVGLTGKAGKKRVGESEVGPEASDKAKKDLPFQMPASHGDPSAPYYELPAGNMMPHIIPNTSIPISTQQMRPLQFAPGPADPKLIGAVQTFLKEAEAIYSQQEQEDEGISMEMDDIGQSFIRDKLTGEIIGGESYYGWSKEFCENMKRKKKGGTRRSRSSSRDGSESPRKRRRYSYSTRSRSRSRSYSRSPSPVRHANSHFRLRSRSRSRSPPPRFTRPRSPSPSPPRSFPPRGFQTQQQIPLPPQLPLQQPPQPPPQQFQPHPPFSTPFPHGMPPLGPDGMPLPPPRPPNWTGPWPPPPPPPPPSHSPNMPPQFSPHGMQVPFPPPPRPGPPPDMSGQMGGPGYRYGYGQGGYGGGYGGRGGMGGGFGDRGGMRGRGGRGGWR